MNILFQKLKRGKTSGQIVVVVILLVAVTVVFIAAMINLAKIAQLKVLLNTAVRNAAIGLASVGSSYGLALSIGALEGEEEQCKPSAFIQFVLEWTLLAAAVVIAITTFGTGTPLIAWIAVGLGAALGTYGVIQGLVNNMEINANIEKQISSLANLDQRTSQEALKNAISGIVGDPVMWQDVHDLDSDTLTDDKVSRFQQFYEARMYHILKYGVQQQLGDAVGGPKSFSFLFGSASEGDNAASEGTDPFQPHWKDFEGFLGAGYKTDDCKNIVPSSYGTSGFMVFLGADKGVPVPSPLPMPACNPATTTGLYKLFYDIRSWGFSNFNIGPRKVWEPDNAPCKLNCPGDLHPRCSGSQLCQQTQLWGTSWHCSSPPTANDELDNLQSSLYDFTLWAGRTLFRCDWFSGSDCDPTRENNLVFNYLSWYPSFYLDYTKYNNPQYGAWQSTYNIYCIMPQWLSMLDDLDVVLRNAFTWTVKNKCVKLVSISPLVTRPVPCSAVCTNSFPAPCASDSTTWQEQLNRITTARMRINEARIQVSNFIEAVSELIRKVEAINWNEDNSVTYSWYDALGWHHIFATVAHFTMPTLYYDDGSFWEDCTYIDPYYCGRRGGGADKVTVIRYDQDQDPLHPLKFLSGSPLWQFLYSNPKAAGEVTPPASLTGCDCGGDNGGKWQSQYPDTGCPPDPLAGINCTNAQDALKHGVKSRACAEWGLDVGSTRFIDCNCYDRGDCQCPTVP
jgi:hypothetical protein